MFKRLPECMCETFSCRSCPHNPGAQLPFNFYFIKGSMSKLTPGYATVGKINLQKEILNLTMREGSKLLNYVRFCQSLKRLADDIFFYNSIIC